MPWGTPGVPVVSDHKTTANFDFGLDEVTLPRDPQGVIYGYEAFRQYPEAEKAELRWNYVLTSPKKNWKALNGGLKRTFSKTLLNSRS